MPRIKQMPALVEQQLTLLIHYDPVQAGNTLTVLGIPTDLTLTEKREIVQLALTLLDHEIAGAQDGQPPDTPD